MLNLDYTISTTIHLKMHGCQPDVSNLTNGFNNNNIRKTTNNCHNGFEQIKRVMKNEQNGTLVKNSNNHHRSSSNSTDDEEDVGRMKPRKPTYKRSSSEGTPKIPIDFQKTKSVRFADCLGLDLVDVREFCKSPPILRRVPSISDYCKVKEDFDSKFRCMFDQPSCQANFYERLHAQNVVLESIASEDQHLIVGFIVVVNLAFKKSVGIRLTTNKWKTWQDINANFYEDTNPSQFTDRFTFKLDPSLYKNGDKFLNLEFAVWYKVHEMEFWDNNFRQNYSVEVKF